MTPCKRGCCWTPLAGVCAKSRGCDCHPKPLAAWIGAKPPEEPPVRLGHSDPTGNTAAYNADRRKGKP